MAARNAAPSTAGAKDATRTIFLFFMKPLSFQAPGTPRLPKKHLVFRLLLDLSNTYCEINCSKSTGGKVSRILPPGAMIFSDAPGVISIYFLTNQALCFDGGDGVFLKFHVISDVHHHLRLVVVQSDALDPSHLHSRDGDA